MENSGIGRGALTAAQRREIEQDEATETVVKRAAKDGGMNLARADAQGDIAYEGEHRTQKEAIAHAKEGLWKPVHGVKMGGVIGELATEVVPRLHGASATAAIASGVITSFALLADGYSTLVRSPLVRDAVKQDALDVALFYTVEGLPKSYVDGECAKRSEIFDSKGRLSPDSPVRPVIRQLEKHTPTVQKHCDEGQLATIRKGVESRDAWLAQQNVSVRG
jgi:hypothetical protein